jgi:hypothetical protein
MPFRMDTHIVMSIKCMSANKIYYTDVDGNKEIQLYTSDIGEYIKLMVLIVSQQSWMRWLKT